MLSILLATYNNEKYVTELIDSILNQSFREFKLIIRDDNSTDKTFELAAQYTDERIVMVKNEVQSGSAQNNFYKLLLECNDDYIMFADADDFWLPDKIRLTMNKMLELESTFGRSCPLLVHTNLSVADAELGIMAKSLFDYEKLSPERNSLKNLIVQNNVTGCTVMINRSLRGYIKQKPESSVMHDWWAALIAAAFGQIGVVYEPTMLYRQHGKNSVGAYDARNPQLAVKKISDTSHVKKTYESMFRQSECFAQTYRDKLSGGEYEMCMKYAAMLHQNKVGKIVSIVQNGFYKNTLIRNIGQFIAI
ncbi:MAG: glycosyltransferase family 2 protein [Oscillospiraceae bacterium]